MDYRFGNNSTTLKREPIKYNVSELSSELDDGYVCPICFEIYYKKEVYQCKKGHCSCKECWEKSLEIKKECMQCKDQVKSLNKLPRARQVETLLMGTGVCCPYSFINILRVDDNEELIKDNEGCKEIIKLENLDNHIEKCSFRFVKCEYHEKGCNEKIRYCNGDSHILRCEYQTLNCEYCSNGYLKKTIEQHNLECPSKLQDCSGCNKKFKRAEMNYHLDKECPGAIIPCICSQFGCNYKIKRENLENHLDQIDHTKQLLKMVESLTNKNNQLSNCIDELTKGKELLISKIENLTFNNKLLSDRNDALSKVNYKKKWIISNYSENSDNKECFKTQFGNQNEFLLYFTNGKKKHIYFTGVKNTLLITLLNKDPQNNYTCPLDKDLSNKDANVFEIDLELNKENGYVTQDDKVEFEFTLKYPEQIPLLSN
ncbi:hypothetical protein DICPUDRAFT_91159 [Dictyostelium purpureum]|uniref:TRAF-type domain-containing protein n=1 Tax=Dictyostelium purpureum TaxID=5786 RepID=F0Z8G2_DICPU|nr:uncharacterized protein DICPUDRAFT_91159 [Dictyostelium purpureum]EGC39719.1 hypothetical protein DICPUDRAFT_91159 [Dictyostelium purpureum]|eukprot:XP_003283705.1 hypothetical protein DICPUDRAFT_91159 [Dictyostelium purpureum]